MQSHVIKENGVEEIVRRNLHCKNVVSFPINSKNVSLNLLIKLDSFCILNYNYETTNKQGSGWHDQIIIHNTLTNIFGCDILIKIIVSCEKSIS